MLPSEYFRRQCYVSIEDVEPGIAAMLERFPGNIVFASDYPHADGTFPGSTTELLETEALSPGQRRNVMRDNGLNMYGLKR